MVRATHRLHCAGPLVVGLTLSVALAACGQSKKSGPTFLSINTATISQGSFKPSIKAISPLESTTNVTLSPETDGRVIKKLVKEGDQVQAGQVILVLDNTQLSAQLDASKSQARYDKVNAERYQFLYEQGAASAKRRDAYATKAITSRDQAIADKANLNYKFVRSPINGVIGDLDTVKIGDYVKTGDDIHRNCGQLHPLDLDGNSRIAGIPSQSGATCASSRLNPHHRLLVKEQSHLYRLTTRFPKPAILPTR